MKTKQYNKVEITKREYEVIQFIETGSNAFWNAFYNYQGRKVRMDRNIRTIATWFNKTISRLHSNGLFLELPFAYRMSCGNYLWANPGINASKANYECITIQEANNETRYFVNKII